MLLLLVLDRFPVPCTESNDPILHRFLPGKCFVIKFAFLYLSLVGHVSLVCGLSAILFTNRSPLKKSSSVLSSFAHFPL